MAIIIKFADKNNTTIKINTLISLNDSQSASITEFKIENGANISDHIHINQGRLSINGLVNAVKQSTEDQPDPIGFLSQLELNFKNKVLATITTPRKIYKNYAIENFTAPIQKGTGLTIPLSINFREIQTAFTQTAKIPESAYKTTATKNRFKSGQTKGQATKNNTSNKPKVRQKSSSVLNKLVGGLL